jgi:hypothetical protein
MQAILRRMEAGLDVVGRHWYPACSTVIALCFMALSVVWVQLVPIFQSPDEPAHFNYAFAIASAGQLLAAEDRTTDVDPRVTALQEAAGQDRLTFHPQERVAPGYGSPLMYERMRRDVSHVRADSPLDPGAPRPTLISVYPFFPYALYAVAAFPFRGDVVTALFACRYASVAISFLGLLVWSRILTRLGVSKPHALWLLAIFSFFPLTSFVSSYVQPDGVAFFVVSLVLLAALKIRDGAADVGHGVIFGLTLALLSATKLQYFLAVGLATIVPVAFAYGRKSVTRETRAIVAAAVAASSTVMLVVSLIIEHSKTNASYFGGGLLAGLAHAPAHSSLPAALAAEASTAFTDLFAGGESSRSFWGMFGWLDTPVRILNDRFSSDLNGVETFGTLLVMLALLIVAGVRVVRTLKVARRRGFWSALRIASQDPVANAYAIFASILFCLYVSSDNVFGAQGRNWYGFEMAAFLCVSFYAPRLLPKRARAIAAACGLVALSSYSAVAAAASLTSVEDRFYGPPPVASRAPFVLARR